MENFSLRIFLIKTASPTLINFQRAKLTRRSINQFWWCNWRLFWRKKCRGKVNKGILFLRDDGPAQRHLQPTRNWPTWASSVFITHPILRIYPRRTTTCSWTEKVIESSPFFFRSGGHCYRGDLVERTKFWIFLSTLETLESRDKKCIWLRTENVK